MQGYRGGLELGVRCLACTDLAVVLQEYLAIWASVGSFLILHHDGLPLVQFQFRAVFRTAFEVWGRWQQVAA